MSRFFLILLLILKLTKCYTREIGAYGLSEDEVKQRLRIIFSRIDTDGNSKINKNEIKEFTQMLSNLSIIKQARSEMAFIDKNGDGGVDLDELFEAMQEGEAGTSDKTKELLTTRFKVCDGDGNGVLTVEELATMISPWSNPEIADLEVKSIMDDQDKNKDGKLSIDEFAEQDAGDVSEDLKKEFMTYDRDGDGYISTEEVKEALMEPKKASIEELNTKLFKSDADEVDVEEFITEYEYLAHSAITDEGQLLRQPENYDFNPKLPFQNAPSDSEEDTFDNFDEHDEL